MNTRDVLIKVRGLERRFGHRGHFGMKTVLGGLSFTIERGERVALIGANGSGKTTLLRILSTLVLPTRGEAWICGKSTSKDPLLVRERIGWMPASDGGFVPRFSGRDNLHFFGAFLKLDRFEVDRAADRLRELPALEEALKTPYYLCSTGMKQSLALCRALLNDPDVLLLDEPTRSLDLASARALREYLRELDASKALLFSTHSSEDVSVLARRTIEIKPQATLCPPFLSAV